MTLKSLTAQQIRHDLRQIAAADRDVEIALEQYGYPPPRIRAQSFETFVSTIVGQLISTEAAAAIMKRVHALLPDITAQALLELPGGALRAAGLSNRKVEYAEGLAQAIVNGQFNIEHLATLSDQEAIKRITDLRGFGNWSAEIYVMFALQRPDIFPSGDLALQIALQRLKKSTQRPTAKQASQLTEHWSPWRSAGSLFLWHYYRGAPT